MTDFGPGEHHTIPTGWKQNANGIPQLQAATNSSAFGLATPPLPSLQTPLHAVDNSSRISELLYAQTEAVKQLVSVLTQSLGKILPSGSKSTAANKPTPLETTTSPPIPVVVVDENGGKEEMLEISLTDARNEYQTYKDRTRWSFVGTVLLGLVFLASAICLVTFNVMALDKLGTSPYTIVTQECTIVGFVADDCTAGGRVHHDYSCRKNVPIVEYSDLCSSRKANDLPLHHEKTHSILTNDFRVVNSRNTPNRYNEERQVDRSAIVPEETSGGSDERLCRVKYQHVSQYSSFCGIVGAELIGNHHLSGSLGQNSDNYILFLSPSDYVLWMVSFIFFSIFILPAIAMYGQTLRSDGVRAYVADILWNNGHVYEVQPKANRKSKHSKITDDDTDSDDESDYL
jgi:hypothetical protein